MEPTDWRIHRMALSGFGRGKDGSTPTPTPSARTAPAAGMTNLTAFIDQGSQFEGKL